MVSKDFVNKYSNFYKKYVVEAKNKKHYFQSMNTELGIFLIQLAFLVDVFFVTSGLLHMQGLLSKRYGLVEMIWKRYIR